MERAFDLDLPETAVHGAGLGGVLLVQAEGVLVQRAVRAVSQHAAAGVTHHQVGHEHDAQAGATRGRTEGQASDALDERRHQVARQVAARIKETRVI